MPRHYWHWVFCRFCGTTESYIWKISSLLWTQRGSVSLTQGVKTASFEAGGSFIISTCLAGFLCCWGFFVRRWIKLCALPVLNYFGLLVHRHALITCEVYWGFIQLFLVMICRGIFIQIEGCIFNCNNLVLRWKVSRDCFWGIRSKWSDALAIFSLSCAKVDIYLHKLW